MSEAETLAETYIEAIELLRYDIYTFEDSEPSNELILEGLAVLEPYASDNFIDKHIYIENYSCNNEDCDTLKDVPVSPYFGWNYEVILVAKDRFLANTTFSPYYDMDFGDSFQQSVSLVLTDDKWKVDDFTVEQKDMNLAINDVERYLEKQGFAIDGIDQQSTLKISGKKEKTFEFTDSATDRPFALVARTGDIVYIGEELAINEDVSEAVFTEDDEEYAFLFDDMSYFKDQIDTSIPEVKTILEKTDVLDKDWQTISLNEDRAAVLQMNEKFNNVLSEAFNYFYAQPPTVEGVNLFEQSFNSWNYLRDSYLETIGTSIPEVKNADTSAIIDDTWMIRNQIYSVLFYETTSE